MDGDLLSEAVLERLVRGEQLSPEDYRNRPAMCDELRRAFAVLAGEFDGYPTLSAKGLPPVGDPVYGDVSSCLEAPGWNLPLLADRGPPMGIQLLGHPHADYDLALRGRWFVESFLAA